MATPTLHVVFSNSAAGSLTTALANAGRKDNVVSYFDNLALGPIDPPDPVLRRRWMKETLGYPDFDYAKCDKDFWGKALDVSTRKIAWFSRRSAMEYTGFLEWLWQLGQLPCEIVDLTDAKVLVRDRDGHPLQAQAMSLAVLFPGAVVENKLFDRALPLSTADGTQYHNLWKRLRAENAPLRVVSAQGLSSAQITHFDSALLSCASERWLKAARVVGEALGKQMDDGYFQAGDFILSARVAALVELGALEGRGNLKKIRESEVRLPGIQGSGLIDPAPV